MNRKRGSRRVGRVIFFIPVIAVIVLVAFGLLTYISDQSGTLVVETFSSGRYSPSYTLHPTVTVGSVIRTSPFNVSLSPGTYTVTYGSVQWYVTPSPRSVTLAGGGTQFANAFYDPVVRHLAITSGGFDTRLVTALHEVTPVSWVNEGSDTVVLDIRGINQVTIFPSRNFTMVFSSPGIFTFEIPNTDYNGTVQVS